MAKIHEFGDGDVMFFISPVEKEWGVMWEALGEFDLNKNFSVPTVCQDLETGETWQYMDTAWYGSWKHCFRHRYHPTTKAREYIKVPVSEEYKKEIHEALTPLSENYKRYLYNEGRYYFKAPPVPTVSWSTSNWITWIDKSGKWFI